MYEYYIHKIIRNDVTELLDNNGITYEMILNSNIPRYAIIKTVTEPEKIAKILAPIRYGDLAKVKRNSTSKEVFTAIVDNCTCFALIED